ncbi:MAG: TolC family protein [Bacteroidales bacterium]
MFKSIATASLVLVALTFSDQIAYNQESYSLDDLVRLTLRENYQLQIMQKQQQIAENMNTPGNAGFLPSVGIESERNWVIQTSEANLFTGATRSGENVQSTWFNAFVELDWMIFDGFSMFARRDRLDHLASLGETETKYYIEQTISDLAKAYYSLIREQQLLESYRQSINISAFRLELEDRKRSVGAGSALLYHQAVVDFNADSSLIMDFETNIRDLEIQINRIINRNAKMSLQPMNESIDLHGLPVSDEIIETAFQNNKDLERVRLEEMLAEADYRIERGARYPNVSVFGNYSYTSQSNELGIIESARNHGIQFGVRVRFNLYDGGRLNTRLENVLLEQESVGIMREDTRSVIESELIRLTTRYDAYMQQYRLLRQSAEAAERSLIIAREQLQMGAINGFDFRQTQLASLQVENHLIELLYALKIIEIDIYRISGVLLDKVLT